MLIARPRLACVLRPCRGGGLSARNKCARGGDRTGKEDITSGLLCFDQEPSAVGNACTIFYNFVGVEVKTRTENDEPSCETAQTVFVELQKQWSLAKVGPCDTAHY